MRAKDYIEIYLETLIFQENAKISGTQAQDFIERHRPLNKLCKYVAEGKANERLTLILCAYHLKCAQVEFVRAGGGGEGVMGQHILAIVGQLSNPQPARHLSKWRRPQNETFPTTCTMYIHSCPSH